ncbi:hypothetical protein FOA43_001562 [Brettanomyces nanus]|uniref:Uncharacterized protein n=1 Tax=Eeniella nana TaxID=13502 RepID=A0A875RU68_EENNA|nr:uncharacterized protein FOA43_001562 [Brettanomyces nanus]QPG74237.1 hypothetical protein FOA43_001562 [Brettanomyces nanus]
MIYSEDSFDDDDVDFDEVFSAAAVEAAKRIPVSNSIRTTIHDPSVVPIANGRATSIGDELSQQTNKSINVNQEDLNNDKLLTLKGENAILRAQLERIAKEQDEEHDKMRSKYLGMIQDKDSKITALNDTVGRFKDENEFLTSENKTLSTKYIRGSQGENRKKRRVEEVDETRLSTQMPTETPTQIGAVPSTLVQSGDTIRVAIVNQATIFQDEKMLFIESISSQGIPGMSQTIFGYLSRISSCFLYQYKDFQVGNRGESIKTSIVNYLIGFENKNRIDLLLSDFVEILLDYVLGSLEMHDEINQGLKGIESSSEHNSSACSGTVSWLDAHKDKKGDGSVLLPLPYLLALVRFSLNYRPKAISTEVLEDTTKKIVSILKSFPEILKQDMFYLSLGGEEKSLEHQEHASDEKEGQDPTDFQIEEKTMHVRILEVFTVCYSMDILESLSKLSIFSKSFSGGDDYEEDDEDKTAKTLGAFWNHIPRDLVVNTLLSTKTPAIFVHSTVEIMISSITGTKFAFENAGLFTEDQARETKVAVFENLITLLDKGGLDTDLNINIYGLNRAIGSNSYTSLLELLTPVNGLTDIPVTHSPGAYKSILFPESRSDSMKLEFLVLKIRLKILQMFELYLSYDRGGDIEEDKLVHLISALVSVLGKQQEMVLRAPRSKNIPLRMELISTIVRLIHFMVSPQGPGSVQGLPSITLREMVIALLRISADSLKNLSIEYVSRLRLIDAFKYPIFSESFETYLMDKFGFIDEVEYNEEEQFKTERTQVEVSSSNGMEINYDDETIDMARDVIGQCITSDEADMLHYSINYDIPEEEDVEMSI